MNSRYDPETGRVSPLPDIALECPIHGECAECVALAQTIEAQAQGRADALEEMRAPIQRRIDLWRNLAADDHVENHHWAERATDLAELLNELDQ